MTLKNLLVVPVRIVLTAYGTVRDAVAAMKAVKNEKQVAGFQAAHVRDGGYTITGWHVDTADWCFASGTGGVGHCAKSTFKWVPDGFRSDMLGFTLSQVRKYNGGPPSSSAHPAGAMVLNSGVAATTVRTVL